MKRLLAYLFLVIGLGLVFSVNTNASGKPLQAKKLVSFILNNVITIDYDGKKESYKFEKIERKCQEPPCWEFFYEVYEDTKLVGKGTWSFHKMAQYNKDLSKLANLNKKLSKNSIKLSGYRHIYLQVYKKLDRVSTYAFVPSNYEAK